MNALEVAKKMEHCGRIDARYAITNKEVVDMYTKADLQAKIAGMYPEIGKHDLSMSLDFNEASNAYILTFRRGKEELATRLEKHDADECMNGVKCVYLGVQVSQFINNFEERKSFGGRAA